MRGGDPPRERGLNPMNTDKSTSVPLRRQLRAQPNGRGARAEAVRLTSASASPTSARWRALTSSRAQPACHFGVQVASSEDVAAAWARFKQAGLPTRTEENTSCRYALQDKLWVEDPDGNAWEVFVVKGRRRRDDEGRRPRRGLLRSEDRAGVRSSARDEGPRLLRLTSSAGSPALARGVSPRRVAPACRSRRSPPRARAGWSRGRSRSARGAPRARP